jgi:hypothetical protein
MKSWTACAALVSALVLAGMSATNVAAADTPAPKPADAPAKTADKPADKADAPKKAAQPATRMTPIVAVSGTVVDAAGKPVAGAVIGSRFEFKDGKPVGVKDLVSGADGAFKGEMDRATVLTATTADSASGGYVILKATDFKKVEGKVGATEVTGIKITAAPLQDVKGELAAADGIKVTAASVSLAVKYTVPASVGRDGKEIAARDAWAPLATSSAIGAFTTKVPAGTYRLSANVSKAEGFRSYDFAGANKEITVEAGKACDAGKLVLDVTLINKSVGKALPAFSVTETKNTEKKTLADFKGKWVFLDFWGYW